MPLIFIFILFCENFKMLRVTTLQEKLQSLIEENDIEEFAGMLTPKCGNPYINQYETLSIIIKIHNSELFIIKLMNLVIGGFAGEGMTKYTAYLKILSVTENEYIDKIIGFILMIDTSITLQNILEFVSDDCIIRIPDKTFIYSSLCNRGLSIDEFIKLSSKNNDTKIYLDSILNDV